MEEDQKIIKIPLSFRSILNSEPNIAHVLSKLDVNVGIYRLYLEKLEDDREKLQLQQLPLPLHQFMKEDYVERYGLTSLADYHIVEMIRSVISYGKKCLKTNVIREDDDIQLLQGILNEIGIK